MILTFYSFKGGVGRSMALANVAVLLAKRGFRVLCVDFDLEAPGLDRYFAPYEIRSRSEHAGLIDLLTAINDGQTSVEGADFVSQVELGDGLRIDLMTCGRQDDGYAARVLAFDWALCFAERGGGAFFERLRENWRATYDFVLIDSRTGLTDSGGICTVLLPDALVGVFTTNRQSVDGVRDVVARAQKARQDLAYDRPPLLVLPLPSRFDGRTEFEKSRQWLAEFEEGLGFHCGDWLPKRFRPLQLFERIKIPYVAYFSFGENLPVLTHGTTDPEGIGFAFDLVAQLIAERFSNVEQLLGGVPVTDIQPTSRPAATKPKTDADGYAYDLYLSYRRERILQPWIEELAVRLKHWVGAALGREATMSVETELPVRESVRSSLAEALLASRCLVPLLSPHYFTSPPCVVELRTFQRREIRERAGPRIFPMTLKSAPPSLLEEEGLRHVWALDLEPFVSTVPSFWETRRAVELDKGLEQVAAAIASSFRGLPPRDPAEVVAAAASRETTAAG